MLMNVNLTIMDVVLMQLVSTFMVDISAAVILVTVVMVEYAIVSTKIDNISIALHNALSVDINECAERTHACPSGSVCRNTKGSYRCKCPAGDCKSISTTCYLTHIIMLCSLLQMVAFIVEGPIPIIILDLKGQRNVFHVLAM